VTGTSPALTDALRNRYDLGRELGRGGMATVYLADAAERLGQRAHDDRLGSVYVGARTVYARTVRKRIRRLEGLMNRLEAAAAEVAAGPPIRPRVRPGTS
jgi:hypothetical protein